MAQILDEYPNIHRLSQSITLLPESRKDYKMSDLPPLEGYRDWWQTESRKIVGMTHHVDAAFQLVKATTDKRISIKDLQRIIPEALKYLDLQQVAYVLLH